MFNITNHKNIYHSMKGLKFQVQVLFYNMILVSIIMDEEETTEN